MCCNYQTENILYGKLKDKYGINNVECQVKKDWCRHKRTLPFDFMIFVKNQNKHVIIELDGDQHFGEHRLFKRETYTLRQYKDIHKTMCANGQNINIIRLKQTDVLNNTYNWWEELVLHIENNKENVFMCRNNEYNDIKNEILLSLMYC